MLTTIRFRCYYCHRVHEVGSAAAGKRGRCACGKLMMVPPGAPEGAGAGDGSLPFARPSEGQGGGPEEQELDLAGAAREAAGDSVVAQHAATWSPAPRIPRPPAARLRVPDIVYVLGRLVALAACLVPLGAFAVHVFAPDLAAGIPGAPAYLGIPAGFWSLVLMALFLGLAGEAAKRRGGRGW